MWCPSPCCSLLHSISRATLTKFSTCAVDVLSISAYLAIWICICCKLNFSLNTELSKHIPGVFLYRLCWLSYFVKWSIACKWSLKFYENSQSNFRMSRRYIDFARKNLNNNDVSRETVFSLYHYDIIVMLRSSKRHRAGPYHQEQRINQLVLLYVLYIYLR